MFASHQTWTIEVLLQRIANNDIALDPRPEPGEPGAVVGFIESVRDHLPLGELIFAEADPGRYTVVDGRERLWAIVHTLRPSLFGTDPGHVWPVVLTPDDLPGGARIAWDENATADPAAFPLAYVMRTLMFLAWQANLENRTDDPQRIKTASDGASRLARLLREAKISVCVLRPDIDGPVTEQALAAIRARANQLLDPGRANPQASTTAP